MKFFDNYITEEHAMVRETCRRFAETEILPHAIEWEEAEYFPDALFEKAGEAGIIGAGFLEKHGGSGGGAMMNVMAIEGLMRGGSTGVAVGLCIHTIAVSKSTCIHTIATSLLLGANAEV